MGGGISVASGDIWRYHSDLDRMNVNTGETVQQHCGTYFISSQ
jgi:hypothetical protein